MEIATERVVATPAALEAIDWLRGNVGPVMFYQSGGCCDGSLPMCFEDGEFIVGDGDLLLGRPGGAPFYIDPDQWARWQAPTLTLDVGRGEPEGFSLPAGPNQHFIIASPPSCPIPNHLELEGE